MKRTTSFALALCLVLILTAGCSHHRFDSKPEKTSNVIQAEIPYFAYESKIDSIRIDSKKIDENKYWICHLLYFQVKDFKEGKAKSAKAYFFEQKDKSRKAPIMIALPPTGGPRDLIKGAVEPFADKGYSILAFQRRERFFRPDKPLEYNKTLFRQAVVDVRRGIDYFHTRDDVDTDRIAVMGVSLGGIIAALSFETDKRIKACATIVSSASLPDILDTSGYARVKKLRKGIMKNENLSRDELKKAVAPRLVEIDPMTYADHIDPKRFLMINAKMDNIIKRKVADKTWESYGKPERYLVMGGHYSTIVMKGYAAKRLMKHFNKVMKMEKDDNGRLKPVE